jgi:hypothetical protein
MKTIFLSETVVMKSLVRRERRREKECNFKKLQERIKNIKNFKQKLG